MTPKSCITCGGDLVERFPVVIDPQSGERFRILSCVTCGLGHTTPQPEDLGAYYGASYYGERYGFTKKHSIRRRVQMVRAAAAGKTRSVSGGPLSLLDVGCGAGSFLEAARADGFEVMGTELGGNTERSRALGLDVRESLEDIVDRAPFDVITMWHSLEHFRDPKVAIAKVRELLAPDGVAVVAVPNADGLQAALFGARWFHLDVPRHLFHFGKGSLEGLIGAVGLRVDGWHHLEVEQELFGSLQSALNSVLPHPNVLFQALTGKAASAPAAEVAASYGAGALLAPLTVPLAAIGVATGRSATLTAICKHA